eukprot:9709538-Prorocentrum_lima.AAC.1
MGLTSVSISIGNEEGIQWNMYNKSFRWSGTNDFVDYIAGTHLLEFKRLLQAYKDLGLLPEGVPVNTKWVVSPPCAGLQDMT